MTVEVIKQYPRNFQTECREVAVQLHQTAISLPEACRRLIALEDRYQAKLNSWIALVNADVYRGTPQATTGGLSEAVAAAREGIQQAGRKVLPL